VLFRSVETKCM